MKAFEEWDRYKCTQRCKESADLDCEVCKALREESWKAALEWIYNEPKGLPADWKALIEEELKNE